MASEPMPYLGSVVDIPLLDEAAQSGIYFLWYRGKVVYVGQAVDMRRRIGAHLGDPGKPFDAVSFLPCAVDLLLSTERHYIEMLVPEYNSCNLAKSLRSAGAHEMPLVAVVRRRKRTRTRYTTLVRRA